MKRLFLSLAASVHCPSFRHGGCVPQAALFAAFLFLPSLVFAGRLNGTLSSTNTELRAFIEGDFANLAIYVGLAAAAFTMIVKRGMGFGWAMIIFAVGIVLKNVGWVMDTITDLSGNLR